MGIIDLLTEIIRSIKNHSSRPSQLQCFVVIPPRSQWSTTRIHHGFQAW